MKCKTFTINLKLDSLVSVDIKAESLSDALERAKKLSLKPDVIQEDVEWIDGDVEIMGVSNW